MEGKKKKPKQNKKTKTKLDMWSKELGPITRSSTSNQGPTNIFGFEFLHMRSIVWSIHTIDKMSAIRIDLSRFRNNHNFSIDRMKLTVKKEIRQHHMFNVWKGKAVNDSLLWDDFLLHSCDLQSIRNSAVVTAGPGEIQGWTPTGMIWMSTSRRRFSL